MFLHYIVSSWTKMEIYALYIVFIYLVLTTKLTELFSVNKMCYGIQSLVVIYLSEKIGFLFLGLPSPLTLEYIARYPTLSVLSQ
jgi:hypothetical protein